MKKQLLMMFLSMGLLAPSSLHAYDVMPETVSLSDLKSKNLKALKKSSATMVNDMRGEAIRDIALSVGATAGMQHQYRKEYEAFLKTHEHQLDKVFDFEKLRLSAGVLPPVISQSFAHFEAQSDDFVRLGEKSFKIEKNARIVSSYPTWRDYLNMNIEVPELPQNGFLPKNAKERKIWDMAIEEGWEQGVLQAAAAWNNAMGELQRDYEGMQLYHILLLQGEITPSILSTTKLGNLVSDDGTVKNLDVTGIAIMEHAKFGADVGKTNGYLPTTAKTPTGKRM